MPKPIKKSTQFEFIKNTMQHLVAKGMVTLETPEPKKIKEALSRHKQEQEIPGMLFFEVEGQGFKNGTPIYKLDVTYVRN